MAHLVEAEIWTPLLGISSSNPFLSQSRSEHIDTNYCLFLCIFSCLFSFLWPKYQPTDYTENFRVLWLVVWIGSPPLHRKRLCPPPGYRWGGGDTHAGVGGSQCRRRDRHYGTGILSPYFQTFMEPRNRFQGMNSASLCSLAGRYGNPIPIRFLAPIDCLKIPALYTNPFSLYRPFCRTEIVL